MQSVSGLLITTWMLLCAVLACGTVANAQSESAPSVETDFLGEDVSDDDLFAEPVEDEGLARDGPSGGEPESAGSMESPTVGSDDPTVEAEAGRPGDAESKDGPGTSPDSDPAPAVGVTPDPDIETIEILGRAGQGLEDVEATSAVVFESEDLVALGIEDVADLASATPNLQIVNPSATTSSFFIRGVGLTDFSANAASAVAVYLDDVPLNSPALQVTTIFDVENVAILRGPQGAGPGRNASAGAIKIFSKKPTGVSAGFLRASQGSFVSEDARDAWIIDHEGAVEVPLIQDILSSRFAFRLRKSDDLIKNGCGGAPPIADRQNVSVCGENINILPRNVRVPAGLDKHVGDRETWAARGTFRMLPPDLWVPGDLGVELLLNLHGSRLDQDSTLGEAIGTGPVPGTGVRVYGGPTKNYTNPDTERELQNLLAKFAAKGLPPTEARTAAFEALERSLAEQRPRDRKPFRGDYNRVGQTTLDTWGGFVKAEIEADAFNISGTTGFDAYERDRNTDTDFTPVPAFEFTRRDRAWQVSQDILIEGELDAIPLVWSTGGFFLHEDLDARDVLLGVGLTTTRPYEQTIDSWGLFAGFAWDFLDDFTLEGGARWNSERKEFKLDEFAVGGIVPFPRLVGRTRQTETWDAPTGFLQVTYRFSDDVSVYWKYSRGFKAGHFNTNGFDSEPADPETIDSFEWGLDASGFDGRLVVTGAAFLYNYEDYQVFQFEGNGVAPPTLEIVNAQDAEVLGAELEVTLTPLLGWDWFPAAIEGLTFSFRGGWLRTEFKDFTNTVFRNRPDGKVFPVLVDYSGNQLLNSPEFEISGGISWPLDFGRWGMVTPRWDFRWVDDIFFDANEGRGLIDFGGNSNLPSYGTGQRSYWTHNVRLTYRFANSAVEIAGWCRNVADKRFVTYAFDVSDFNSQTLNFLGDPRSCGADVSFNW